MLFLLKGLGLFAARQLEQYTMVIEYIGQLIRNELCEIREKIYEQQVFNFVPLCHIAVVLIKVWQFFILFIPDAVIDIIIGNK